MKEYKVRLSHTDTDDYVEVEIPGSLVGGYFMFERFPAIYNKFEIIQTKGKVLRPPTPKDKES